MQICKIPSVLANAYGPKVTNKFCISQPTYGLDLKIQLLLEHTWFVKFMIKQENNNDAHSWFMTSQAASTVLAALTHHKSLQKGMWISPKRKLRHSEFKQLVHTQRQGKLR